MNTVKYPEWIRSTPRLILVILTVWLVVFTYTGIAEVTIFKDIALVVFWYFFGSRWSESPTETVSITDTTVSQKSIDSVKEAIAPITVWLDQEEDLSLTKSDAYDNSGKQWY